MPIDPECQVILDQMASMNMPDFSEMTPEQARMVFASFPRPQHPTPVAQVDDRSIPQGEGRELAVRVYSPDTPGPRGALLYLHGGGWVMGDLDIYDEIARILCSTSGLTVVTVDYRLAPETRFPGALEDCDAALAWLVDHADELGVDPARVGVVGDSSGGNLAAALALQVKDRGSPKLAFQALVCPILDHRFDTPSYVEHATGCFVTRASLEWFWDHYLPEHDARRDPYASPACADDLSGLPSTLIVTAEYDPLRDEGERYAKALVRAGVDTQLRRYDGAVHGFIGFSQVAEISRRLLRELSAAAAEALGAR